MLDEQDLQWASALVSARPAPSERAKRMVGVRKAWLTSPSHHREAGGGWRSQTLALDAGPRCHREFSSSSRLSHPLPLSLFLPFLVSMFPPFSIARGAYSRLAAWGRSPARRFQLGARPANGAARGGQRGEVFAFARSGHLRPFLPPVPVEHFGSEARVTKDHSRTEGGPYLTVPDSTGRIAMRTTNCRPRSAVARAGRQLLKDPRTSRSISSSVRGTARGVALSRYSTTYTAPHHRGPRPVGHTTRYAGTGHS